MVQNIIVWTCIAAALLYAAWRFYVSFTKEKCSGCDSCPLKENCRKVENQ